MAASAEEVSRRKAQHQFSGGCQTGTYYDENSSVYLFVDYSNFWVLLGHQQQ